jgi:alpha-1,2-mannosyltransferase
LSVVVLSGSTARRLTSVAGVVVVVFLVCAPTTSREHVNDDIYSAGLGSWRIAATGSPWMEGVATEDIGIARAHDAFVGPAANGHDVVHRSPGVVAAGVPAHWLAGTGPAPEDFTLTPGALTAALLVALCAGLFYLTVSTRLGQAASLLATAAFTFATPMWSVAANGLWTHTVTTLGITGMAWASVTRRWWLVGIFGGIGLWGRLHVALIVAVVGVGVALSRRRPGIAVAVGATSGAMLCLACAWSYWIYGTWRPSGGYSAEGYVDAVASGGLSRLTANLGNELALWVSLDRGILVWTPVLLLLLPALVRGWSDLPDWSRWLLLGGIAYTLVQGQLNAFHGGDGFYGYRHGLEFLAAAAPAFVLSAQRAGSVARALLGPVLAVQVAAITVGAVSEGFYVRREDAWSQNGFWLALTHVPEVWVWLAIMLTVGMLGSMVWRDRGLSATPAPPRVHADSTVGPSTG